MDILWSFVNDGTEVVQGQHTIMARIAMTYLADVFMVDLVLSGLAYQLLLAR